MRLLLFENRGFVYFSNCVIATVAPMLLMIRTIVSSIYIDIIRDAIYSFVLF